ncbi:hypothetical protein [Crossiella sp. CA198]|uniref:hypothetical protein n=1 Tax=Crossiella sp. CA198 TaxID=3455607 RepID=UPI003F8D7FC4
MKPEWYEQLSTATELAELGFRFLPAADLSEGRHSQIRVGDIGGFTARLGLGISLILRPEEPEVLYARFADDHGETLSPEVTQPERLFSGRVPLVEIPLAPTVATLTGLYARYVAPGRTLPAVSRFISPRLIEPGGRVTCYHEQVRRLRIPLGVVGDVEAPAEDPVTAAESAIIDIERDLIFNSFLATCQWTLHTGNHITADGTQFRTPYTSADTLYSRSLLSLDCRYSEFGAHLTLEVDYAPEPDTSAVRGVLSALGEHWPDNDLLPDDLPFDVLGAIAGLHLTIQPMARQRQWLDEGDDSTLIGLYYLIAENDSLPAGPAGPLREFLTPYAHSPHENIRDRVAILAQRHGLTDLSDNRPQRTEARALPAPFERTT